jgi:hypothetical protein
MKLFRSTVLSVAAAAVAALTVAVPAQASTPFWRVALTKHYGGASDFSGFTTAVVSGAHDAWALGVNTAPPFGTAGTPVAQHWNGKKWLASSLPRGVTGAIIDASVVSSKSIWAITDNGGDVLHWNGTRWTVAKQLPGSALRLSGMTALNDRDVWVFGETLDSPYVDWHYNGRTWTSVTGVGARVEEASALSASNIWGIAYGVNPVNPGSELVRYNGSRWVVVTPKSLKGAEFAEIWAQSATSVWIAAYTLADKNFLVHYSRGRWSTVKLPWPAVGLEDLVPDGTGGFWLSATVAARANVTYWLEHRSAKGRWTRAAASFQVLDFAVVPKTDSLLLPGSARTGTGSNAVLWAHGSLP